MYVKIDRDGFWVTDMPLYRGPETDDIKLRDDNAGPFNRWLWQAGSWVEGAPKTAETLAVEAALNTDIVFKDLICKRIGDSGTQLILLNKMLLLVIEALTGNADAKAALEILLPNIRSAFDYTSVKTEVAESSALLKEVAAEVYGEVVAVEKI